MAGIKKNHLGHEIYGEFMSSSPRCFYRIKEINGKWSKIKIFSYNHEFSRYLFYGIVRGGWVECITSYDKEYTSMEKK